MGSICPYSSRQRFLNRLVAREAVQNRLVGVFDGGWLIATALGDHSRARCFARLSDTLGFVPTDRLTTNEVVLEQLEMPDGLAAQVHQTAMTVIRRL
mgnify:CR=1 FL=1